MSMTKGAAAQALHEIAAARGRVWRAMAYGYAAPYLVIWGFVWLGANLVSQFAPRLTLTWIVADLLGLAASFAVGFAMVRSPSGRFERAGGGWRNLGVWLLVLAFLVALVLVVPITNARQAHTVVGVTFGFIYLGMGLWMGWRLAVVGGALVALTLLGFYQVHAWYPLYMGLVGGGALILGGVWLRRV